MCKLVEMTDGKFRLRCEFCGWQSEPMSKQSALTANRPPHECKTIQHPDKISATQNQGEKRSN